MFKTGQQTRSKVCGPICLQKALDSMLCLGYRHVALEFKGPGVRGFASCLP